ncbi:MAG TPA: carboxypeptidase-like regulatory domain-containing protein, partial [Terriglobales bacterium]|nr:carboxypeptidase-like regulatory domain-containing protein [Terriglobales bacterium]
MSLFRIPRRIYFVAGVTLLSLAVFQVALAQGGSSGAITGEVLDVTGAVIPDATVKVVDSRTGEAVRTLATGSNGGFKATLLPPGTYSVQVAAKGFGTARSEGVEVRVTETTTLSVTLRPAVQSQEVEVTGQIVTVNTENATTGQTIEPREVVGLPLATRNFQQLLTLSTGASSTLNNSEQLGRGTVAINVNGQREDNNNYLIEGISATDNNVGKLTNTPLPSPDVIQEFKVQTSLYDASQGRNGGGMVNAVLRSGTNHWHGDAFEFFRNDKLNANDYFLARNGQARPVLKQNIFGGSVGGPLGKDGKFGYVFGNYQGTRQRSGADLGTVISTTIPILPTDRSNTSLVNTFLQGVPNAAIDPVVLKLLNATNTNGNNQFCSGAGGFLIPTIPGPQGSTGSFTCSNPGRFTDDQFTTTWNRDFRNSKDKIAARLFFSNSDSFKPFGAGGLLSTYGTPPSKTDLNFPLDIPLHTRFLNTSWTHLFANNKVNEFTFGYVRINNSFINVPFITASDLGINRPMNPITKAIYKFTFISSGFQIGPSPGDNSQTQNNFIFNDVFSWVRGNHTVRIGGELDRLNLNKSFPQVFNGQIFFANTPATGTTPALTDFQNFLLGSPQFVFGQSGAYTHEYHHNNIAGFLQDDWKVRRDLTLNLGLRLESFGAWHDGLCHIGNFDASLILKGQYPYIYPDCVNKFNVTGLHGTANSTTLNNKYATNFAPRIGLAYDLFGHHTTTIRAGYGIYYVQQDVGAVDNLAFQAPLLDVVSFGGPPGCLANYFEPTTPAGCPNPNPNGLPAPGVVSPAFVPVLSQITRFADASGNTTSDTSQFPQYNNNAVNLFTLQVPRHFIVPKVQQWNLTVQRALPRNFILEVGYVGSHTIHLREVHDALQSVIATPQNPITVTGAGGQQFTITKTTLANALARSPYQGVNGYSAYEAFVDNAYAHYNSLQTTLSRHFANSYVQAAYTFSRSTDATSSSNTAFNTLFNNQLDINGSRGLSDFDRRHRLSVSYLQDLSFFNHATGLKKGLLGGWSVSGVTVFQSGLPFSIFDSGAGSAYVGLTTVPGTTANLAPGVTLASGLTSGSVQSRLDHYLNINAFSKAPVIGDDGAATGFGTLGRNIYHGPFQQNWDFSLIKNFTLTEKQKLRFAADFFDLWNHPAFSSPAFTDVENP